MIVHLLDQFYEHAVMESASAKTLGNLKGQLQAFRRDFPFKNSNSSLIKSKDLLDDVVRKDESQNPSMGFVGFG
jgi:hypothetical protein